MQRREIGLFQKNYKGLCGIITVRRGKFWCKKCPKVALCLEPIPILAASADS